MDYKKILGRFFEMAGRLNKSLNEVFAMVPNSYQQYASQIQAALREDPPEELGKDDWAYVEALIGEHPEQVLVECYHSNGKCSYYLYDVAFEDGSVKWSNQREVEVEAALKVKPVMERRMNETVEPPQDAVVDVSDFDIVFEEEDEQYASVAIAQKADVLNRNNRIYPKDVLEDAVERLKTRIKLSGPIGMETMHRDQRYIGDVCAVIHEVHFNRETGIVTLPKIQILETTAGKNVKALLDVVPAFQVSQRGIGISHEEVEPGTGQRVQIMDWLEIQGWDIVWNGDASVEDAVLTLNENVNSENNGGGDPDSGQQQQQQQQSSAPPVQQRRPTSSYFSQRQSASEDVDPPQRNQQQQQQQQDGGSQPVQQNQPVVLNKEVVSLVETAVQHALGPFRKNFETEHKELRRKEFNRIAEEVLDDVLAKHPRFNEKQKAVIKSGVNISSAYDQCDTLDAASVSRVLTPVIQAQVEQADKLIAQTEVESWGLPSVARGNTLYINNAGRATYNEVLSDAHASGIFEAAEYNKIVEGAIDQMTRGNRRTPENPDGTWVMPLDHSGMFPLAEVMNNFFRSFGSALAMETQASGVGIPINQVSMLLVPVAWRMTSAFQIAQLHPMTLTVEDIPIEKWTGQQSTANDWERWNALDPGDNVAIPESVLDYEHYKLAVGYQPQHVSVTPRARALTRNTVMNPTVRSTALAAREIVDQNDLMLWRALIMEAMKLDATEVTTWTSCPETANGSNVFVAKEGLIPYEWVVTEDSNKNVAKSGLIRNFPADGATAASTVAERTLTPLEVIEGGADNTPLEYKDDYTVDWVSGEITLTASGRTKEAGNGIHAKYTYATNFVVWDGTVPSGSTFLDHLVDLRFKIADARIKVKDRHYEPECIAWNYGLMDKISAGKNFTNDGGNIAQQIDAMSRVLKYAGSESIDSTAIPSEYIIVTQKMSILFGMHTPFRLTGQVMTDNTGNERHFGEQFAGAGVPVPEKASIVGVKNIP